MSGRVAAAAGAGLLVLALLWMRTGGPRAASPPPPPSGPTPAHAAAALPSPAWSAVPARNPFEYLDEAVPPAAPAARPAEPTPPVALSPAAAPPVRLVGLLRQGGGLKAVLQVSGEVVVVGQGGEAGDYEVVSIDEDRGVRLRARGGEEVTLPPPGP